MRKTISTIMIIVGICLMLFGTIGCFKGFSGSGDYEIGSYHKVYKGSDDWYYGKDVQYLKEKPRDSDGGMLGLSSALFGGLLTIVGISIKPDK